MLEEILSIWTIRRIKGLKCWEGSIRLAASGGDFGVGRVTSECFLACGFAVTGLGILSVRVSQSLEDHRIAPELPVR